MRAISMHLLGNRSGSHVQRELAGIAHSGQRMAIVKTRDGFCIAALHQANSLS